MSIYNLIRTTGRLVLGVTLFGVALLLLMIALFRFQPSTFFSLVGAVSPLQIQAKEINTRVLPVSIKSKNFQIEYRSRDDSLIRIFEAATLFATLDLIDYFTDKVNFWHVEVNEGKLNMTNAEKISASAQAESTPRKAQKAIPFQPHQLLSKLNLNIENTQLVWLDKPPINIKYLVSKIDGSKYSNFEDVDQKLDFSLQNDGINLSGQLHSHWNNNASNLRFDLNELDLRDLSDSGEGDLAEPPIEQTRKPTDNAVEVDWTWLDNLDKTLVNVSINRIWLASAQADGLSLQLTLDKKIILDELSADLSLKLSETLNFRDTVNLRALVEPIVNGSSVNIDLQSQANTGAINLKGELNLLSPFLSSLAVSLSLDQLDLVGEESDVSKIQDQIAPWLPMTTNFNINSQGSLPPSSSQRAIDSRRLTPSIRINDLEIKASNSDLNGTIEVENIDLSSDQSDSVMVKAKLHSKLIDIGRDSISNAQPEPISVSAKESSKAEKLFSDQTIDLAWMKGINLAVDTQIDTLVFSDYEFTNVQLPLTIVDQTLNVGRVIARLNEGEITASIRVDTLDGGRPELTISGLANDLSLTALYPSAADQISGGKSRFSMQLTSEGESSRALASNLVGNVLFHVENAKIANDAFELIGSDIFSELLSRLNPFVRSDPSTELECGVVNLNFKDSIIDIDKSVVVETSKMRIVADGNIDLASEKLNIEITPQATAGIGLDVGSLVKFMELGGTLTSPKPKIGADGLLETGVAIGAAISTGGVSVLADGVISKLVSGDACKRALEAH